MNVIGVAVCIVVLLLVIPLMMPVGPRYLLFLWSFRGWFLVAALGWVLGLYYVMRRGSELLLRTPLARTRLRERKR